MGVCQSAEAILETPADARYHEEKKAAKAEAIADLKATPRDGIVRSPAGKAR